MSPLSFHRIPRWSAGLPNCCISSYSRLWRILSVFTGAAFAGSPLLPFVVEEEFSTAAAYLAIIYCNY